MEASVAVQRSPVPGTAGYAARPGANPGIAPVGVGPAVIVSISPNGVAASGAIAQPSADQPLSPAGYVRAHLNSMFRTSRAKINLSQDFENKLADHIAHNNGKIDLKVLRTMIIEDAHLDEDDIREDSFFGVFGFGQKEVSFDTIKANITFYEPLLTMRMEGTGDGLAQVLRCKLSFYKMEGTEGEKDNIIGMAKQDKNRFKQHMDLAWAIYVNSAPDQTEGAKRRKEYGAYQTALENNTDPPIPAGVKEYVFQSYLIEFDAYCIIHNVDREKVDLKDPAQKDNFLKGVFSDFVVRGQIDKTKLSGSFWNFLRKAVNDRYSMNPDVLANYPKTPQPQPTPKPNLVAAPTS